MRRQAANENDRARRPEAACGEASVCGELHVIGTKRLLRALPIIRTDRERFLSVLRSRSLVTHADAIEALWGANENGGPLYAQHLLAIYVTRLRRAGHLIENHRGVGYRIQEAGSGSARE